MTDQRLLHERLREWMSSEAGDAPIGLVEDVMDAVAERGEARSGFGPDRPVLGAVLRYAALAATIAAGVAVGVWISTSALRQEPPGTTPAPAPSESIDSALPRGPLHADESVAVLGRRPTVGPSGVWYETADGIGLLPGGAGPAVDVEIWEADGQSHVRDMIEAFGSLWIADQVDGTLTRLDAETRTVLTVMDTGRGRVAATGSSIWFVTDDALLRVDPATNEIRGEVIGAGGSDADVVAANGTLWVATGQELLRVDEGSETIVERLDHAAERLTVGGNAIWGLTGTGLIHVDLADGSVQAQDFSAVDTPIETASEIAWADDRAVVMITDRGIDDLVQLAYPGWRVLERTSFARQNDGVAVGFGAVWVGTTPDGRIWRMTTAEP